MTEGGLPLSELLEKAGDGVGLRASVTELPTARTMLPNDRWLCLFVWCKACHHQAPANLQAIIDSGRGDKPLKDLRFRCKCGSSLTDSVVMGRDALRVKPWRSGDADSTSSAAGHLRGQRPWTAK